MIFNRLRDRNLTSIQIASRFAKQLSPLPPLFSRDYSSNIARRKAARNSAGVTTGNGANVRTLAL
jgi:hypothetical protein